ECCMLSTVLLLFLLVFGLVLSWSVLGRLVLGLLGRRLFRSRFCLCRLGRGRGRLSLWYGDRRLNGCGRRCWGRAGWGCSFAGRDFGNYRRVRGNRRTWSLRSAGDRCFRLAAALLRTGSRLRTRGACGNFFPGGTSTSWWWRRGRRLR